jgi:hypothetical protein
MSGFNSRFHGMHDSLLVTDAEYIDGLTFTVQDQGQEIEAHLGKDELLRLHAALGTYIIREGLAL